MTKDILEGLSRRFDLEQTIELLSNQLSASELNSLLMDIFVSRTAKMTPAGLYKAYLKNRFVHPAAVDPIAFAEFELSWLKAARSTGFMPLTLSPVSVLGACSVVGTVHQHKVLSALRGTEVMADVTNALALESTRIRREQGFPLETLQFSTVHRHVRTQELNVPGFTPHFKVFCLTSAGKDTGDTQFERENLRRHIGTSHTILQEHLGLSGIKYVLKTLDPPERANTLFDKTYAYLTQELPGLNFEFVRMKQDQQRYYRSLQFGIILEQNGQSYPIGDGGFVDWTQQLAGNRKERFLISGIGIEFLYKLLAKNRP